MAQPSLAQLDAILAERPGDDAAHAARALILLELGRLADAEGDAMDAVRIDPDEVRYRELLAEVQSRRGEHADAAAEYARLSRHDPGQVAWTVAEAAERLGASETGKAVEAARRAVRLDPTNFEAQLSLARGLVRLGDGAGALRAATLATELRSSDLAAREALADALWLGQRDAAAFDEFRIIAAGLFGVDHVRVIDKMRSLYRLHAGWLGRAVASSRWLFAIALGRGWIRVA